MIGKINFPAINGSWVLNPTFNNMSVIGLSYGVIFFYFWRKDTEMSQDIDKLY